MTIELITFDLDDTLWDTAPVIASAETVLQTWLAENAPKLGALDFAGYQALRQRVLVDACRGHRWCRRRAVARPDCGCCWAVGRGDAETLAEGG